MSKKVNKKHIFLLTAAVIILLVISISLSLYYLKWGKSVSQLQTDKIYMAKEEILSKIDIQYYLQLKTDNTYILTTEDIYGEDEEYYEMETLPDITYSYGTYKQDKNGYYLLTPERGVVVLFKGRAALERKKADDYTYIEKEKILEQSTFRIEQNIYYDKNGKYYLAVSEDFWRKRWIYETDRTSIPSTIEEFLSQFTYEEKED